MTETTWSVVSLYTQFTWFIGPACRSICIPACYPFHTYFLSRATNPLTQTFYFFSTCDRVSASLSVRLMEHMNRFSYAKDTNTFNTVKINLELKMWMKPGATFNGSPPIHVMGCHESPLGEDCQGVKEELGLGNKWKWPLIITGRGHSSPKLES